MAAVVGATSLLFAIVGSVVFAETPAEIPQPAVGDQAVYLMMKVAKSGEQDQREILGTLYLRRTLTAHDQTRRLYTVVDETSSVEDFSRDVQVEGQPLTLPEDWFLPVFGPVDPESCGDKKEKRDVEVAAGLFPSCYWIVKGKAEGWEGLVPFQSIKSVVYEHSKFDLIVELIRFVRGGGESAGR